MARIRDFAFTEDIGTGTAISADMPVHVSGDLLIAFCNCDGGSYWPAAPSGWADVPGGGALAGNGHGSRVYYKQATSSSETFSVTLTTGDTKTITMVAVRDFDTTTPFDGNVSRRTTDDSSVPFAGIGHTTSNNNSLCFSFLSTDGGLGPVCSPGWTNIANGDAGANSGGLAYTVKKTAGTLTAPDWYGQINDNTTAWLVAINDDGNLSSLDPYIQPGNTTGTLIEHGYWITGAVPNAWGNTWPVALSLASIGSKTAVYDAASLAADTGINPYWGSANCTPAASTTGANVGGPQVNFGSSQDLTGGIVFYNYQFGTARDYVDVSTPTDTGAAGMLVVFADASNNYKAWSVGAKNTVTTDPYRLNTACIQVDQTDDTSFASSGTLADDTVTYSLYLAQGRYGAVQWRWTHLCIGYEQPIAGGTSAEPLNFDDLDFLLNRSLGAQRVMIREGSAATFLLPIRFGGTDPIHLNVNLRTLQYRTQSDGVDYLDWHVDPGTYGFEFDGQANDTLNFIGCVFTAGSPYYWRFNAGHSASANIDFTGSTVVNAYVTLQNTVTLDGVVFTNCPTFDQNGATLTNVIFNNTKVSSDTLADMALISNSTFNSGGTGHAIEVGGTASTITLSGLEFNDYAASNGSTGNEAIYVNIASGTVTINISGGGSTPSIRTAGATVVVNNTITLTLTGLVDGSDITILDAGTTTERVNVQENSGTTYDYSYSTSAEDIDIGVFKAGYVPFYIRGYTLGATDASVPVAQVVDRAYLD